MITAHQYYAGLAMQALISKIPLHDAEGQHGIKCTRDDTARMYQDVADSAHRYARAMVINEIAVEELMREMTHEEADAEYDAAPSIPISDEDIERMVKTATKRT
jgi:hypothetical protein